MLSTSCPACTRESLKWGPELRGSVGQPIVFTGEDAVHPVLDSSVAIPKGSTWDEEGDGVSLTLPPGNLNSFARLTRSPDAIE